MITSNSEETPQDVTPVVQDEMVIDTQDFDIFSSLDDLVEEDAPSQQEKNTEDDVIEEDTVTEEDEDEEEVNFDDIDDIEQDENGHDIDEEDDEDDEEDVEEEFDFEDDDEDSEEIDFNEYQVTLPSGEEISLSEAVQGYKDSERLKEERQQFEEYKEKFKEEAQNVSKRLDLSMLEADRVIADYKDFDWARLAKEDPQAYVENKEFLERYKIRRDEIVKAIEDQEKQKHETEKEEQKLRAKSAVAVLEKKIPGWNQSIYEDLINYAVDQGVEENVILNATDPSIFILLNKAAQFDRGKQVVKAKIKRQSGSPKKVMKPAARDVKQPDNKRKRMERKMDSGDLSDLDLFNSLED